MKTWIFQGNPDQYDIDGYLSASTGTIYWRVTRYAKDISAGDTAYIWRSQHGDDPAGIVAEGTVLETPKYQHEDDLANAFWKHPHGNEPEICVRIRLNRIARKKEIIKREWLSLDSILSKMHIMNAPAGTNFLVSEEQAKRLGQLWRRTGVDWERDEVIAAMELYERLRDKEISKIPGSEVEQLSQRIGRASSGVYNKLMNFRHIDPNDLRKGLDGGSDVDKNVWAEFTDQSGIIQTQKLRDELNRLWGKTTYSDTPATTSREEKRLSRKPLRDLEKEYERREKNKAPVRRSQGTFVYDRDALVISLRKKRSNYCCEVPGCQSDKFKSATGEYFVEIHHLMPLSEGGPDILENTVAVCPTHHRLLHYGKDRLELTKTLLEMREAEEKPL